MNFQKKLLLFCTILLIFSCDNSNSGGGGYTTGPAPSNALVAGADKLSKSIDQVGNLYADSQNRRRSIRVENLNLFPFGNDWNITDFLKDPSNLDGPTIGFSSWVQKMLNPNAVDTLNNATSPTKHLDKTLETFCKVGVLLGSENTDENNYPAIGIYAGEDALKLTEEKAELITQLCKTTVDPSDINKTYNIAVFDTAEETGFSALYERHVVVQLPNDECPENQRSFENRDFYLKNEGDGFNFATVHTNCKGTRRELASIDSNTKITRYEYLETPPNNELQIADSKSVTSYRFLYNENTDLALVMGDFKRKINLRIPGYGGQVFAFAGYPNAYNNQLSISTLNILSNEDPSPRLREACIDIATGALSTDGARCVPSLSSAEGISAIDIIATERASENYTEQCGSINLQNDLLTFDETNIATVDFTCIDI